MERLFLLVNSQISSPTKISIKYLKDSHLKRLLSLKTRKENMESPLFPVKRRRKKPLILSMVPLSRAKKSLSKSSASARTQPVPVPQVQERLTEEEKQNIGERIFNVAMTAYGNEDLSGRLTGMILDSVQVPELYALMANEESLKTMICEAKAFLDDYVKELPEQQ